MATIKFSRRQVDGEGKEHYEGLTVTDADSLDVDGVWFVNASLLADLFKHPERTVRLSLSDGKYPMVTIVDAPPEWRTLDDPINPRTENQNAG